MTKIMQSTLLGIIVVSVGLAGLPSTQAASSSSAKVTSLTRYEAVLKGAPAYELPARAASLVRTAKPDDRERVALQVIQIVSRLNPSAVPSVVGAISKVEPSLAPKISTEAAKLQPKLSEAIHVAAAAPAPAPEPTVGADKKRKGPPVFVDPPKPSPGRGKKKGHYKSP